jgi:hypothetical protein
MTSASLSPDADTERALLVYERKIVGMLTVTLMSILLK